MNRIYEIPYNIKYPFAYGKIYCYVRGVSYQEAVDHLIDTLRWTFILPFETFEILKKRIEKFSEKIRVKEGIECE